MSTQTASQTRSKEINGVDVDQINSVIDSIDADSAFGKLQFRARNRWLDGGLNRSEIKDYFAGGQEDALRKEPFILENDEPPLIAGKDSAPNPVEYILHALAGCLTTTMVTHAAVRGIQVDNVSSILEGDLDLRGIFGMSDEVRKGYNQVRVVMQVKSEADVDTLTELAMFSPVYDIVSNSLPVDFKIEKC